MSEFAIKSDRIVTPEGIQKGFLLIRNGLITDIEPDLPSDISLVVNVGHNVVMPGIIDPHVHINEPGRTEWEGFETATKAAATGGITLLVDMPLNSSPVTTTVKAFDQKLKAAHGKLHTNCGFWGGIIPGNENEIEPLIDKGILGFKAFLTHSGIDEFPNVTEADLRKAMPLIAKHNLPLLVHCELESTPDSNRDGSILPIPIGSAANTSYAKYLSSRPRKWEDDAIALMIRLCEEFNCRTHIVHLSSADSIEQIAKAKHSGLPLTVETAQHYLYFNAEGIRDGQTQFKCAPPIREEENNERLWDALKSGIIDLVATDHSPAIPGMKELISGDFSKAWGGISSIQFALPALWSAAKEHGCTINDMAKWLCEKPAELIGKQDTKGKIAIGYDADLVIWDPDNSFMVKENSIVHKHKITPYLNEGLYGIVEHTWLAGEKVFDNGKFLHLNKGKPILR